MENSEPLKCAYCDVTAENGREIYLCELCHSNVCSDCSDYLGTLDIVCAVGTSCARDVGRE